MLDKIKIISTLVWESWEERKYAWLSLIKALKQGRLSTKGGSSITNLENQSRSCRQIERKEKQEKRAILKLLLFYYNFSLKRGLGLGNCSLRGSLVCTIGVTFDRYWKTGKDNLYSRCLLVFGKILGSSRGLSGIRGHSLSHLSILFFHSRLLATFGRLFEEVRTLSELSFSGSASLEGGFTSKSVDEEAHIAGGK